MTGRAADKPAELQRKDRLAHLRRCEALGIRPQWEREFRYYPPTQSGYLTYNVRLAARHPRAAWEHARDDALFQAFLGRLVPAGRK